jgi:ABC-type nitrate/sulfonate/bicarbonate transport system substrate-binding protein
VLGSIANDFPGLGFTFLAVADKDLADPAKRKALEAYVRVAIVEASRFIMKNPGQAAEIMHKWTPETPVDLIRQVIVEMNRLNLWGVNGGIEPEITDFTAKLGHEMGVLKRSLNPGEGIDRSLAEKAVAGLGAH